MEENTCLRKNVRRGIECDVITWVWLNDWIAQCTLFQMFIQEYYSMGDVHVILT